MQASADQPGAAPYVVLEHLQVAGYELCRVVASLTDQMEAHTVATSLADAGLRVWVVDLYGEGGEPSVERYVGAATASSSSPAASCQPVGGASGWCGTWRTRPSPTVGG